MEGGEGGDPFAGMGASSPARGGEGEREVEEKKEEEVVEPQVAEDPRLYQFSCSEEGDDQLVMQVFFFLHCFLFLSKVITIHPFLPHLPPSNRP